MITVEAVEEVMGTGEYLDFCRVEGYGAHDNNAGKKVLEKLGGEPGIVDVIEKGAPSQEASAGFLFGFTFCLYMLKREEVL